MFDMTLTTYAMHDLTWFDWLFCVQFSPQFFSRLLFFQLTYATKLYVDSIKGTIVNIME